MPNIEFENPDQQQPCDPLEVAIAIANKVAIFIANPDDPLEVATSGANPDVPLKASSANPDEALEFAIACTMSRANVADDVCLSHVIKHFQEEFDKVPLTQHQEHQLGILFDTLKKEEARRIAIKQMQEVPALPPDTFELQVFNNHFVVFWLLLKAVTDMAGGSSSLDSFLLMIGIIAML